MKPLVNSPISKQDQLPQNEDQLISIIIVNWNGKKWLKRCLDSLLEQTYKNYEIIIVDNNSTDGSVSFTRTYYPRVKVVESTVNLGFAGGNNLGISNANGSLIMLLNNDTWLRKNFLRIAITSYKREGCDVIAPVEADYYQKTKPRYRTTIDPLGHPVYQYSDDQSGSQNNFYLSGACIIFKKILYEETGGLDENFFMYFEEIDWFWRMILMGKSFKYIDNLYIYHAGAGSTGKGIKYLSFLWRNQNTLQMLLKNYSLGSLIWVLPLYLIQNLVEIIFFLLILRPQIAFTYIRGWYFNIIFFKQIMVQRKWVQKNRIHSDLEIFKILYRGSGKLMHLLRFLHS